MSRDSRQLILFFVGSCLMIDLVFSDTLCKNRTIEAIAYAPDVQMYFISIGSKYWWVKDVSFPLKESDGKPIPAPFTRATAAVYIDGDNACKSEDRAAVGLRVNEKMIWISDVVNGQLKLMSFDIKLNKWSKEPIAYDQDHCIVKAQLDWTSGKPIDAMFTRNYLDVYILMGDKYAMVDCRFLCSNPEEGYGTDKQFHTTSDWSTTEPISAITTMNNKKIIIFHQTIYHVMQIDETKTKNGKLITIQDNNPRDIFKDFLRIPEPSEQCDEGPEERPPSDDESSDPSVSDSNTEDQSQSDEKEKTENQLGDNGNEPNDGSHVIWIVIVVIVVFVIALIGIIAFFALRKKPSEDVDRAEAGVGAKGSPVSPNKRGSKIGSSTGSKKGVSGGKVPNSSLAVKSTRSSIGKSPKAVSSVKPKK